jgi:predicted phosphodiesterase
MKIAIFSDLHIEWSLNQGPELNTNDADVIVIAGDIASHTNLDWVNERFGSEKNVLYVLGNHEYYNGDFNLVPNIVRSSLSPNIRLLNNESVTIDNVTFHGSTLWTNFRSNPLIAYDAARFINDFRVVRHLSPERMESLFYDATDFLEETVNENDVVITHFAPALESVHPNYKGDNLNGYFVNDCADLIRNLKPKLWIHGHTHTPFDYTIEGTRIVANPHGYPGENKEFNSSMIVEI